MTKLEYPGFILWWQDKNRFPLRAVEKWRPWYLWAEEASKEREQTSSGLPAKWLATKPITMHSV